MSRRQTVPKHWFLLNRRLDLSVIRALAELPRATGVLLLQRSAPAEVRALRRVAMARNLVVAMEGSRAAARVHDVHELTRAGLRRTPIVLISPLYPTQSHPDWKPMPLMRAAALARLAISHPIALGGMTQKRFRRVERLGFVGWAGIGAWQEKRKGRHMARNRAVRAD